MIDVDALINHNFYKNNDTNKAIARLASLVLKKLVHQDEINQFIKTNRHLEGFEFNDAVLEYFQFTFRVSGKDRLHIPDHGRVIIVANHPLGSLDGLALLKMVSEIRTDVSIVATTILSNIEPLQGLLHSIDNTAKKTNHRRSMHEIVGALEDERAVIMFPTGEVSRIRPSGVRDGKWKTGFLYLAKKAHAPIVPVHIEGKNSTLFYGLSSIYKPLGTMMLVNEMFNKVNGEISIRIGKPVPWEAIAEMAMPKKDIAKMMRKQVYLIGKKKKTQLFRVIENVIHPAKTQLINKELKASELIGTTHDGKRIYLFDYRQNSHVMREIGRLRELSFRQVREGTGNPLDIDAYDRYYRHLILWDEEELEIVGSYRIGEVGSILHENGLNGLYAHSLFKFGKDLFPYLKESIELGRSFVQPRYQGKRSLDYLWYGIGAYLQKRPEIKYMYGPVSLSNAFPGETKNMIASFYSSLFGNEKELVQPRSPFVFTQDEDFSAYRGVSDESEYRKAFSVLKEKLANFGVRVPTLYKQYVELCEPGGCEFLAFNIDKDFSDCIDALVMVHVDAIREKKRQRYISHHRLDLVDQDAA